MSSVTARSPSPALVRAAVRAVRGWLRGLNPAAQAALSAHDARALAEQIGWAVENGELMAEATVSEQVAVEETT